MGLLISFLAAWVPALTMQNASQESWSQFRGDPSLTGIAASTLPENLELLWSYEAGEATASRTSARFRVSYWRSN